MKINTTRAVIAAFLLCIGLDKVSAQIDPSAKPVSNDPALLNMVAPNCTLPCGTTQLTAVRGQQAQRS